MSLLDEAYEQFVRLNKVDVADGYGGYTTAWTDGAVFNGAVAFDDSLQARVAEKEGVTSVYTIITPKSFMLEFHDVVRRVRDGKIFRITSDGDDKFTPESASLNMRVVTAEEWRLTNE